MRYELKRMPPMFRDDLVTAECRRLAMMGRTIVIYAMAAIMATGAVDAQSLTGGIRRDYRDVRDFVIRAAEKMPDGRYAFRPTPAVRSFAQQIAHIADDQYNLCAPARHETREAPYRDIETRLSRKDDLLPALRAAFAYCDAAYDALTDVSGAQPATSDRNVVSMLNWNLWHTWEHYGNLVVYLRLNGLVPPSSEPHNR